MYSQVYGVLCKVYGKKCIVWGESGDEREGEDERGEGGNVSKDLN